jgi:hypothetical protein
LPTRLRCGAWSAVIVFPPLRQSTTTSSTAETDWELAWNGIESTSCHQERRPERLLLAAQRMCTPFHRHWL